MLTLPPGLAAHIAGGATTLCWCWRLTRADGLRLGFTDHDRNLSFDGTLFEASSGFTSSDIKSSVGLNVDNLEVMGALESGSLNEHDLANGLFDDAGIEIWRVNWADAEQRVLVRKGTIGEVSRADGAFTAEIRGLAHYLNQERGRSFQYACDAELGDARCGIDIDDPAYRGEGVVVSAADGIIRASGLDAFAAEWFTGGFLIWTSGALAGLKAEVKSHRRDGSIAEIDLWHTGHAIPAVGDGFRIHAGCDKSFATCRAKFSNALNFRGFPHIPGNDFVLSVARTGGAASGEALVP